MNTDAFPACFGGPNVWEKVPMIDQLLSSMHYKESIPHIIRKPKQEALRETYVVRFFS